MRAGLALGLVLAFAVTASAAGSANSPPTRGKWMCSTDSPSHRVRLWWNERRHDEQTVAERYETVSLPYYTDPPTDANCRSRPQIVQFLATAANQLLARDRSLGLPAPHPDTGMPATWGDPSRSDDRVADGGSGAIDIYLLGGRSMNDGDANCVTWERPRGRYHSAAYVTLYGVRAFNDADREHLRRTLAHELVHVAQCAITNTRGDLTATMIDRRIVEATAETYAVASSGTIGDSMLDPRLRLHVPLLTTHVDDYPATPLYYAEYPFWYRLLGAPSAHRYVAFMRRAVARGRRVPSETLVRASFGGPAVQRALTGFASFALLGGKAGTDRFDPGTRVIDWRYEAELDGPGTARVSIPVYGYAFVRIRWPDGVTNLAATIAGATTNEAVAGTREGGSVNPNGSVWSVTRNCTASGACEGDGYAYVALANGRRSPMHVVVTVR